MPPLSPVEFATKWKGSTRTERAASQEHFIDISGFRYTPTSCFETFPFPEPDDGQRGAIADAAKRLDALRLGWVFPAGADEEMLKGRTLNRLYNEAPAWLRMAHERLDKAVYAAYGWAYPLATGEVLERLMLLNVERAASQAQEGA